ncbi:MAG: MFS transporter, partial [Sphingobacteriales bacterium]
AMLPLSLALLFAAPFSAYIGKHFNAKPIIQVGLLVDVIALLVLRASTHINTTPQDLILGMALYGIGMGLVFGQISNLTLSSVSVEEAGEASGINNTLRQVGSTFGSAIIGAVLLSTLTAHLVTGINQSPIIPIQIKDAITQNVTAQTSNVEFGGGAQVGTTLPENIQNEIASIGNAATTEGSRTASAYAALFAFFGLLVSFFLPKYAHVHDEQMAMESTVANSNEDSEADIAAQGKQIPSDEGGSMAQSAPILASSRNNYIGISFAALILIIVGLFVGYGFAKHRDAEVTKDNAPLEQPVVQRSGVVATPQPTTESSPNNNPTPTTPVTPEVPVTPAPTQTYLNNSIGLQFSIPAAWTMRETFGAKYTADFYDQSVWTAEVSVNPGSNQSTNDLYQEISADPQNTQITAISIAGASGYQFYSQAHSHIARAIVYRGNTYYFLGALNDLAVQKSLKLF